MTRTLTYSCGHERGGRLHASPASPGLCGVMRCRGARAERLAGQISDEVRRKKDLPSVSGGLTGRALLNDSL